MISRKKKSPLYSPKKPSSICRQCKKVRVSSEWINNKCLREGKPELVVDDLHRSGHYVLTEGIEDFYWPYCANFRCGRGKGIAERKLTKAKNTGVFKTMKTPEGKLIKGADASSGIKSGFVDEKGMLYAYHNHDPASGIVMPTGQKVQKKPAKD